MDENFVDPDKSPLFIIPKMATGIISDYKLTDNVLLELSITTPNTVGEQTLVYAGYCHIKLIDSYDDMQVIQKALGNPNYSLSLQDSYDIEDMPVIFTNQDQLSLPNYDENQVWIDPSRSPYIYNHYDATSQEDYSILDSGGLITVQQNHTYITQNVFNYDKDMQHSQNFRYGSNRSKQVTEQATYHDLTNSKYNNYVNTEDEYGEMLMSRVPEFKINRKKEKETRRLVEEEDNALKQLMSSDMQSASKQRKTILFQGHDIHSGETIQNISYNDSNVYCTARDLEVDHEVVIEHNVTPTPKKKKYQCDQCKQIFCQISEFRQHMVRTHINLRKKIQSQDYMCTECGKILKTQEKFEVHCAGHGNPELECPKCLKVYASKFSLRTHVKIHNRKFSCDYCVRSYSAYAELKTHLKKAHCMYSCDFFECLFGTNDRSLLSEHQESHKKGMTIEYDMSSEDTAYTDVNKDQLNVKGVDYSELEGEADKNKNAESVMAKGTSNKEFLFNSIKAKSQIYKDKICTVCQKQFDRASDLKRHLIEHTIRRTLANTVAAKNGTYNIVCEVCQSASFNKIDQYKAHLRDHASLTIYKCTFCDKTFSDSSNFSKHKKVHGSSFFQCDLCQRKFNTKKMLIQHMQFHNRNETIICEYCDRKFFFESTYNKHIKAAHTKHVCKFTCRFCKCCFSSSKDKWDHEWLAHNVRKSIADCFLCGAKFRKYLDLKRHSIEEHQSKIPPARALKKYYARKK